MFDPADELNTSTANHLAWYSRLRHYNSLVLGAGEADEADLIQSDGSGAQSLVPLIAFDFLRLVGFIGSDEIDRDSRNRYCAALESLRNYDEDAVEIERQAAMMMVMHKVKTVTGQGTPLSLLMAAASLAHALLTDQIPFGKGAGA